MKWWDTPWNPVIGCSPASPGCDNCYAARDARVRAGNPLTPQYAGLVGADGKWTGETRFVQSQLLKPLSWLKGKRIFVCNMGDLFHPSVPFEWVDEVMMIICQCSRHRFHLLTKRPDRMRDYFGEIFEGRDLSEARKHLFPGKPEAARAWLAAVKAGLPNVWLGVTVEHPDYLWRIRELLATPAAHRFVSYEPALGPVIMSEWISGDGYCEGCGEIAQVTEKCAECGRILADQKEYEPCPACSCDDTVNCCAKCGTDWSYTGGPYLDLVICGGETGSNARPMYPGWARSVRDQCKAASVPFFFKQWGEWQDGGDARYPELCVYRDGRSCDFTCEALLAEEHLSGLLHNESGPVLMSRVGSRRAGRLLDGVEHNAIPHERSCRVCGCTQNRACPGGCWWVGPDLCSACAGKEAQP